MKTKFIFLILCAGFSFYGATAQTYYYNTTKTFNENGYTYQCDKASYGIVTLYNKANKYTYAPYANKDGSTPSENLDKLFPFIADDNWTKQKSFSIVNNIFSREEKMRVKGSKFDVSMTIDTSTGKVIEVDFSFFYSNPVGTIPVSTFRKLELELKSQIWFTLTNNGKKLKFVQIGWMHEIDNFIPPPPPSIWIN